MRINVVNAISWAQGRLSAFTRFTVGGGFVRHGNVENVSQRGSP